MLNESNNDLVIDIDYDLVDISETIHLALGPRKFSIT